MDYSADIAILNAQLEEQMAELAEQQAAQAAHHAIVMHDITLCLIGVAVLLTIMFIVLVRRK